MNKVDAYNAIIGHKLWIDRAVRRCESLKSTVEDIVISLKDARDELSEAEEYLKKFQPKKEQEND